MTTMNGSIREAAMDLVRGNAEDEPDLLKAYLFPADGEIRLIYVDETTSPLHNTDRVAPFYFGTNRADGRAYPLAIALIRPEEDRHAPLPEGWGSWGDAEVLWENGGAGSSVVSLSALPLDDDGEDGEGLSDATGRRPLSQHA